MCNCDLDHVCARLQPDPFAAAGPYLQLDADDFDALVSEWTPAETPEPPLHPEERWV